jgi:phosphoribosylaminoimidazole-succinocarboxamide synthase
MPQKISEVYRAIKESSNPRALFDKHAYAGLTDDEITKYKKTGDDFYRGKVRDLLIAKNANTMRVIHSDRLTAFDKYIDLVPYKGTILTAITRFWFEKIKAEVPTHFIQQESSRILLVEKMKPLKIEVVVRGYLAGSMLRAYEQGERTYCGAGLPDDLAAYERLPQVVITPTTKAAVFEHDENITADELIKRGVCTDAEWDEICEKAIKVFHLGSKVLKNVGWMLVDTKYEFGKDKNGQIKMIDEAHTPDSSRFWVQKTFDERVAGGKAPEMLDKENVRRWLMERGFKGEGKVPEVDPKVLIELGEVYLKVAETLIGEELLIS